MLVEADLITFLNAGYEYADECVEAQHGSLAMGFVRRHHLASTLCCHAASISATTPPAFPPCGRLERGASSVAE